jgi:hypothetical protein
MTSHKFVIGQKVEFRPGSMDGNIPLGSYTIVKPLPIESNLCRYRVKHVRDGHERVVAESQLAIGLDR